MVCCIDSVLAIEVHVRVKVPNTVHSKCNISNIDSTWNKWSGDKLFVVLGLLLMFFQRFYFHKY